VVGTKNIYIKKKYPYQYWHRLPKQWYGFQQTKAGNLKYLIPTTMKKLFTTVIIAGIITTSAIAQTRMGYMKDVQGAFAHTTFKSSPTHKISGTALDLRINYSLLGSIFFRNSDKKFFIGDHIGCGLGVGRFKKPGDNFPLMLNLNLEFGFKTTYAINSDLDIGVKYILGAGNYFTDYKNDFSLVQKPAIIPGVRFKNMMLSAGYGKAKAGASGSNAKGNFMMMEGRFLLKNDDDNAPFFFLRYENYTSKFNESDYTTRAGQIYIGFGIM
jgi:hypothetical protein